MNISELKALLKSENIPERRYLLDGKGVKEDKVCLEFIDGTWQVYYSERGKKYNQAGFATEDEACRDVLQRLIKKGG